MENNNNKQFCRKCILIGGRAVAAIMILFYAVFIIKNKWQYNDFDLTTDDWTIISGSLAIWFAAEGVSALIRKRLKNK